MPRKSRYGYTGPAVDGRPSPLEPPANLTGPARDVWVKTAAALPPEHFNWCDTPLLTEFCHAVAGSEDAYKNLIATGGPVLPDGKLNPWAGVQMRYAKLLAVLATRLRLSPQSRRDPKSVARGIGGMPLNPDAPWRCLD